MKKRENDLVDLMSDGRFSYTMGSTSVFVCLPDPSPFPRIGLWNARRALSRLVRGLHPCSFVVGLVAGVLVGQL